MPEGEQSHSPETAAAVKSTVGPLAAIVIVLEVLLAAALVAATTIDTTPAVPAPTPVAFPTAAELPQPLPTPSPSSPGSAALRSCLATAVANPHVGPRLAVAVAGLTGRRLYSSGPDIVTPASTIKLFTTTAALGALGPSRRFTTTVRISTDGRTLALVGGGDPLLARGASEALVPGAATLKDLAARTAAALGGGPRQRLALVVDDTLFTGPAVNPAWEPGYVADGVVSPISALWVDEGRVSPDSFRRSADPAAAAGRAFAALLRKEHVAVRWSGHATAANGFTDVASVAGPTVLDTVRHVLAVSDNEGAEVLARQVAIALGEPASFVGARTAVTRYVGQVGVDTTGMRYLDGSGLSRHDRVPVAAYFSLMRAVVRDPRVRPVLTDLPVSGFSGTLGYRYDDMPAVGHGTVHAKTGTLTGVHGLVGYVVTSDGAPLLFVAVADRVPSLETVAARADLARITSDLAGCAA